MKVMFRHRKLKGWGKFLGGVLPHQFRFVRKLVGGKWEFWEVHMGGSPIGMWMPVDYFDDEPDYCAKRRLATEDWGKK